METLELRKIISDQSTAIPSSIHSHLPYMFFSYTVTAFVESQLHYLFLRQGNWPQTHCYPPAYVSQVLEL